MRINKLSRTICYLSAFLSLAACTKEMDNGSSEGSAGNIIPRFSVKTLEGVTAGEETTYRIITYEGNTNIYQYQLKYTGTYYWKKITDEELTACDVDDNGTFKGENLAAGMNGASGKLLLVAVSPGVKHGENGTFQFVPTTTPFKSSYPELTSIGGYGHIPVNALKDCRATVALKIYKNKNVSFNQLEISDPKLLGAGGDGELVTLYPASRQVAVSEKAIDIKLTAVHGNGEKDNEDNPLYYTTEKADWIYVAAAIYAPLEETEKYLGGQTEYLYKDGNYLYMTCKLTQNNQVNVPILMPLTPKMPELLPQHHYTFKILISSTYITASVDVFDKSSNDWQDGNNEENGGDYEESEITKPNYTVELGTWRIAGNGNDWEIEDDGMGDQEIGGNKG